MKATRSELSSYVSNPPPLPVAELCVLYGQNEEGMVGELIAFCTSTHKDGLTSEILNSFEHEVRTDGKQTHCHPFLLCRGGRRGQRGREKSVGSGIRPGLPSQRELVQTTY